MATYNVNKLSFGSDSYKLKDFRNAGVFYGTCDTAADSAAKVVTCANYVLTQGAMVFIKFTNAQTVRTAITLAINGTAATTVKFRGSTTLAPVWTSTNEVVGFVYDGTNYEAISIGPQASGIPYGDITSNSTTVFTAEVPGVGALVNGVTCFIKNNGNQTSAAGWTLDVNGLGAKPVYQSMAAATASAKEFNKNYTGLFMYNETRVSGGCWDWYWGYNTNTDTIGYQLRTNSTLRPAADTGYRYRLWFTSLDGTKWVPANTSTSTNATASRTPNSRVIDPFGEIIYCSSNGDATSSSNPVATQGNNLPATTCWQEYAFTLGYSFNTTGSALVLTYPAPVYIQCTPQSGGGAVINGYTQSLPSTADGKIYIFLGMAYAATTVELAATHPVYQYVDGKICLYTGQPSGGLPSVTSSDNGKVLRVVNGAWAAAELPSASGVSF